MLSERLVRFSFQTLANFLDRYSRIPCLEPVADIVNLWAGVLLFIFLVSTTLFGIGLRYRWPFSFHGSLIGVNFLLYLSMQLLRYAIPFSTPNVTDQRTFQIHLNVRWSLHYPLPV